MMASQTTSLLRGKRVVIVQQALRLGGAERQGLLLAQHLAAVCGSQVEFWGLGSPGDVIDRCNDLSIPWRLVPCDWEASGVKFTRSATRFAGVLRDTKPDAVLPFTNPANVICGLAWRFAGARTCIWNQRDVQKHRLSPFLERLAARLTPIFVSNSEHGASFVVREYGISPGRVHVVRNGVEAPREWGRDREERRLALSIGSDDFVACMVAHFHEFKDHRTVVRAWSRVVPELQRQGKAAILLLPGYDYCGQAEVRQLVEHLGIGASVRFPGQVADVPGLIDACDLCVFCARNEGVPNGVLECMARGLCVVGSDSPALREALGHDGEGLLVEPGNAESLAERILRIATDAGWRRQLGEANRDRVRRLFDPQDMCTRMEALLIGALARTAVHVA